jgi:transcriptional regulator with XRE-family HTH domain
MHYGKLIRDRRIECGLTQGALARRMGAKQSTLSRLERSCALPSGTTMMRIARALGYVLVVDLVPNGKSRSPASSLPEVVNTNGGDRTIRSEPQKPPSPHTFDAVTAGLLEVYGHTGDALSSG